MASYDDFDNFTLGWFNITEKLRSNATDRIGGGGSSSSSNDVCRIPAHFYAMGIVIPSGFFANIFCLIVFSLSAGLRRTTTGHYLTALACADTLFLVGDFMRWLNTDGCTPLRFMHTSDAACKGIFWMRYGAKLVSAWMTVTIATERFITVAFPLKVSRLSTARRAKVIIVALFVVGFSLGSYSFWTLESDIPDDPEHKIKCVTPDHLRHLYNAWNFAILAIGTLFLPGLFITVLTAMTVIILLKASRRRREHMEGQPVLGAGGHAPLGKTLSTGTGRGPSSAERQLTITLVAVCVAFIFLRLPYTLVYFMAETLSMKRWPSVKYGLEMARRVTDVIATSNYVVNLMLYCLFGSYFRQQVVAVYCCRRMRRRGNPFRRDDGGRVSCGLNTITINGSEYSTKSRSSTITRMSLV